MVTARGEEHQHFRGLVAVRFPAWSPFAERKAALSRSERRQPAPPPAGGKNLDFLVALAARKHYFQILRKCPPASSPGLRMIPMRHCRLPALTAFVLLAALLGVPARAGQPAPDKL